MKIKRLVEKADLQDHFKEELIEIVLENELVNEDTKTPYLSKELEVLTYDELVDLIVDSQEFYVVDL